jgi:primosomal protein N' (replication factor Y)
LQAEVLVSIAHHQVDKVFYYNIPPSLAGRVQVGSRVLVPFGRRKIEGYVVGLNPAPNQEELKDLAALLDEDPIFTPLQLALARWMAAYYLCPTVKALRAIIWPLLQIKGPKKVKGLWPAVCGNVPDPRRAPKSAAVWEVIQARPGLTRKELAEAAGVSPRVVDSMVARGLLASKERIELRDPCRNLPEKRSVPPVLYEEQLRAVKKIIEALDKKDGRHVFLLHGVTGSGKTEVYLQAIAAALNRGKQAIVLVPEIALTPQMIDLFRSRFGHQVAVLHSRLSDGERYDEYHRLRTGEAKVVLGARSAIFSPLEKPGLIILDEEHEPSYKQEESPRYHARTVALRLAGYTGAVVVLGSATPSLESYCQAAGGGTYQLLELNQRVGELTLPSVHLIDLRRELRKGNKGIFSGVLQEAIADRLSRREQVILFLNRRGYSTLVVCRECGLVLKCPHCDISLTYHASGRLRCHYCNYSVMAPSLCPGCGSHYVAYLGMGTQKVEQEIRRLFPAARVLRLDSDTVGRRGAHREIIETFREGEADILVGTQMVAKGLDIPGVTLVGVINADISLHMPDFRASERTFQLLTQVAGRSGRGKKKGEVMIQTYSPEHYAITCAQNHDYRGFYRREMALRRALGYPPFTHLARLLVTGKLEREVQEAADFLAQAVRTTNAPVELLGPAPAPIGRIKDRYRWHLVLKAPVQNFLREAATAAMNGFYNMSNYRRVQVSVDIAPQSMM